MISVLRFVITILLLTSPCALAATPSVSMVSVEDPAYAGRPFRVTYEVTWDGAADAYTVMPPEFEAPSWGEARLALLMATTRDGQNVIEQVVEFTAYASGTYEIPEMHVGCLDPNDAPETSISSTLAEEDVAEAQATLILVADAVSVDVRNAPNNLLRYGGALAFAVCVIVGLSVMRDRRRMSAATQSAQGPEDLSSVLHRAKQHRLDGKFYEYYVELARAAQLLSPREGAAELAARLSDIAQDVGYRSQRPTDDDMDAVWRDVDRLTKKSQTAAVAD